MKYTIIIESGDGNYSAYVPDLLGCVAIGDTREEVAQNMKEAIEFHLEGILQDGEPIPKPSVISEQVEVVLYGL